MMFGAQSMMAQEQSQSANEAQRPTPEQMNEMIATRTASELMLNEATTAKFIPIYENYLKAMQEAREKYADKPCCGGPRPEGPEAGPRPEGAPQAGARPDGPRPEAGPRPDGKRGPKHDGKRDGKRGPKGDDQNAPKPDGKPCCGQGGQGGACPAPKAPTDAEVEKMVKDRIALMREEADIQEKYYKELRNILTPLQTVRVLDFKK
jgi:hypothetical protein